MHLIRERVLLAVGVVGVAGCELSPPAELPPGSAVATTAALWVRLPTGPAGPRFGMPTRPRAVVSLLEVPPLRLRAAVTADTSSAPLAPRHDPRWRRSGREVRRCSRANDPTSCEARLPGAVWEGAQGVLVRDH